VRIQQKIYCDNCMGLIGKNQTVFESNLSGSGFIDLCGVCARAELQAIQDKGTYDIPELLLIYNDKTKWGY